MWDQSLRGWISVWKSTFCKRLPHKEGECVVTAFWAVSFDPIPTSGALCFFEQTKFFRHEATGEVEAKRFFLAWSCRSVSKQNLFKNAKDTAEEKSHPRPHVQKERDNRRSMRQHPSHLHTYVILFEFYFLFLGFDVRETFNTNWKLLRSLLHQLCRVFATRNLGASHRHHQITLCKNDTWQMEIVRAHTCRLHVVQVTPSRWDFAHWQDVITITWIAGLRTYPDLNQGIVLTKAGKGLSPWNRTPNMNI